MGAVHRSFIEQNGAGLRGGLGFAILWGGLCLLRSQLRLYGLGVRGGDGLLSAAPVSDPLGQPPRTTTPQVALVYQ
jgi:hypothetical protein